MHTSVWISPFDSTYFYSLLRKFQSWIQFEKASISIEELLKRIVILDRNIKKKDEEFVPRWLSCCFNKSILIAILAIVFFVKIKSFIFSWWFPLLNFSYKGEYQITRCTRLPSKKIESDSVEVFLHTYYGMSFSNPHRCLMYLFYSIEIFVTNLWIWKPNGKFIADERILALYNTLKVI